MSGQRALVVEDDSQVGAARRAAANLARACGLSDTEAGRAALIVTELGTNLRKHAGRGELLLQRFEQQGRSALEVVAIDRGPGMNLDVTLRDGHSTAGTRGEGLGAVQRGADEFDGWSAPRQGAVIAARVWAGGRPELQLDAGGVSLPYPGQTECGDAWSLRSPRPQRHFLLVADGLGHGPIAARASGTAVAAFQAAPSELAAAQLAQDLHAALRPTRGAAIMVVDIDLAARQLRCCGVGNIAGTLLGGGQMKGLVSLGGIAGHEARRFHEFVLPLQPRPLLVAHSDGLLSQWKLDSYPGLLSRRAAVIAGVLYRDFRRKTDDSTVVVIKEP